MFHNVRFYNLGFALRLTFNLIPRITLYIHKFDVIYLFERVHINKSLVCIHTRINRINYSHIYVYISLFLFRIFIILSEATCSFQHIFMTYLDISIYLVHTC